MPNRDLARNGQTNTIFLVRKAGIPGKAFAPRLDVDSPPLGQVSGCSSAKRGIGKAQFAVGLSLGSRPGVHRGFEC